MNAMGHQNIIERVATTVATIPTRALRRMSRQSLAAVVAAAAGVLSASICVAASRPLERRAPHSIGIHDAATRAPAGFGARRAAAPVASALPGIAESSRKAHESAAHAKARYPRKPAASSDTAKARGMTDAELASWLTDIRRQASAPIVLPREGGEAQLHPMHAVHSTDS